MAKYPQCTVTCRCSNCGHEKTEKAVLSAEALAFYESENGGELSERKYRQLSLSSKQECRCGHHCNDTEDGYMTPVKMTFDKNTEARIESDLINPN